MSSMRYPPVGPPTSFGGTKGSNSTACPLLAVTKMVSPARDCGDYGCLWYALLTSAEHGDRSLRATSTFEGKDQHI